MLEQRRLLASVTWVGGTTGYWDVAANWSGGAVPAATADVTINPASPATVTIQTGDSESVNSVTLGAGNTLLITGGSLTTVAGLTNSGTITVNAACDLTVGGSYTASAGAVLSLPGGGDPTLPTTNSLSNSGFELPVVAGGSTTTKPANWGEWGTAYLSTQYAYTGSQSVMISGAGSAVDQIFTATPGESFTASCYAMTPASNPLTGGEYAELQIEFENSSGTQVSTWSQPYDLVILTSSSATGGPLSGSIGNQGWNHFSTTAVAPAGTAKVQAYVDTHIYSGSGGGAAYFDGVTFGPSAASGSALVAASISNSGSITVGASNTIADSGTFAQASSGTLDVQIGNAPSTGIFGSLAVTGAATLAGAFEAQIVYNEYTPSTTDTFTPVTFASASGTFASYQLPSGTGYQFAASVTFTNVVLAAYPTTALTATVSTASALHAVATGVLGINARYKNGDTLTSQAQQMLTAADLQLIRIPGGSDSDDWHFNVNYTASSSSENNFGPLLELIANTGATGLVTIDYGSGSPQEGAAALAYALGSPTDNTVIGNGIQWNDTTGAWQTVNWGTVGYWASLRAAAPLATDDGLNFLRIDHPAPFTNAAYWEVGNEEYGTWEVDHHGTNMPDGTSTGAQHDPTTYVAFAEQFAALASEITTAAGLPAISIGIVSGDPSGLQYNGWTEDVLSDGANIGFVPGFISDHSYMHGSGIMSDGTLLNGTVSDSASIDDWSTRYADYEALLQQTLTATQAASVQILGTEYNSTSAWDSNSTKQSVSLVNGLFIAESIGSLMESGYQGGCVWDLNDGYSTSVTCPARRNSQLGNEIKKWSNCLSNSG